VLLCPALRKSLPLLQAENLPPRQVIVPRLRLYLTVLSKSKARFPLHRYLQAQLSN
jgi:hypothetical protein